MGDKYYYVYCDIPAFTAPYETDGGVEMVRELAKEGMDLWWHDGVAPDIQVFESEDAYHRREALVTFAPTDEHHALLYIDGDPNSECEFDVEADVWKASPELTSVVDLEHCEHGDYFLFCGSVASAICAAIRQGHVKRYLDTGHELVKVER